MTNSRAIINRRLPLSEVVPEVSGDAGSIRIRAFPIKGINRNGAQWASDREHGLCQAIFLQGSATSDGCPKAFEL